MLDRHIRPWIDGPLNAAGGALVRLGVTANGVTLAGFAVGLAAMAALAYQAYGVAAGLIVLNRLLDGLDGAVARGQGGGSDFGGFLDIVADFIVYAGVIFAFALGRPDDALAAAFLIFAYMGTGSSFLAYAILAAKHGHETSARGPKALYYIGGLAEGTETAGVMLAICLFPEAFAVIAVAFGAICWITTVARIWQARLTFAAVAQEHP